MVDARPDQLKTILKTCPKENGVSTIEKGKCAKTGKEVDWPIDLKKLFFACKPTEVSMEKYHGKLVTSHSYLVASKTTCRPMLLTAMIVFLINVKGHLYQRKGEIYSYDLFAVQVQGQ